MNSSSSRGVQPFLSSWKIMTGIAQSRQMVHERRQLFSLRSWSLVQGSVDLFDEYEPVGSTDVEKAPIRGSQHLDSVWRMFAVRAQRALVHPCYDESRGCPGQCSHCEVIQQSITYSEAERTLMDFISHIDHIEANEAPLRLYQHLVNAGYDADLILQDIGACILIQGHPTEQSHISDLIEKIILGFSYVFGTMNGYIITEVSHSVQEEKLETKIIFINVRIIH